MAKGVFIVLEGGEGVGKTSQACILEARLKSIGKEVLMTREPGASQVGAKIRRILLEERLTPMDQLDLFIVDRRIHVSTIIKPALGQGMFVLCDRFSDSTVAYQHYASRLPRKIILERDREARAGLVPDLVIVLDMPIAESLARTKARGEYLNVFEREKLAYHEKVRNGFINIAIENHDNHAIVRASEPIGTVAETIWKLVQPLF